MLNSNNIDMDNTELSASYNAAGTDVKWYSYGNYYNWYSATAGNGNHETDLNTTVNGDICPAGWHLPYGGEGDDPTQGDKGNTSGGFYYLNQQMGKGDSVNDSNNWRSFPNNFTYSGNWNGASARNRGTYGGYWSSTTDDIYGVYGLGIVSGGAYPGVTGASKSFGVSVRCVAK